MRSFGKAQTGAQVIFDALRRRLWRVVFAKSQDSLGSFFLDPRDHIGVERIVNGDIYEFKNLNVLGELISALKLGSGCAVDIGANIGNHSCWFSKRFSRLLSFEPGSIASLVLEANLLSAGAENYTIYKCALSDKSGLGKFVSVSDSNLGSSQVDISHIGAIELRIGDDVLLNEANIELVKIDVEGAEIHVLNGLQATLAKNMPLLCIEMLEENLWFVANKLLSVSGYKRFYSIQSNRGSGLIGKIASLFLGRVYSLVELPHSFPNGGYDMIICLSQAHIDLLENHGE